MKLCQYYTSYDQREVDLSRRAPWEARVGLVVHDHIVPVTNCVEPSDTTLGLPLATRLVEWLESRSAWARLADWASRNPTGSLPLRDVYLGPPLLRPSALLDFLGFEGHAKATMDIRGLELSAEWHDEPVYYSGNPTALFGHGQRISFPRGEERMDFEMELACVIGRRCRDASVEQAGAVIAGYCIMNDWSARSAQAKGLRMGMGPARGKDHATSLGPYLVSKDQVGDVGDLMMRAEVNGEVWCEGNSGGSRFTFEEMVAFASRGRTLFPGDIIGSGSAGSGLECGTFLKHGDVVRLEVEGLGVLENTILVE